MQDADHTVTEKLDEFNSVRKLVKTALGNQKVKQELVRNGILESNIIIEVGSAANKIRNRLGFQNLIKL